MPRTAASVALIMVLIACRIARAEEPAPDPSRGDSYDGRRHGPGWKDDLELVPRLMLLPPRLLFRGLGWSAHKLLDWDEIHRVHENIIAAFSSDDGKIGLRPGTEISEYFCVPSESQDFNNRLLRPSVGVAPNK